MSEQNDSMPGPLSEQPIKAPQDRWGDWVFLRGNLTLVYRPGAVPVYEIDLEKADTSAQILDWIFQVRRKGWATPAVLADLLEALADILQPQANFCSFGKDKPASGKRLAKAHAQRIRDAKSSEQACH